MNPSYIVDSEITSTIAERETYPEHGVRRFAQLPPRFGFVIVTWTPDEPELVREIHWNTEEERRRSPVGEVGRIVERAATEYERRDGEWQHSHPHRRVLHHRRVGQ